LHDVKPARGAREAALLGDGDEVVQVPQLDVGLLAICTADRAYAERSNAIADAYADYGSGGGQLCARGRREPGIVLSRLREQWTQASEHARRRRAGEHQHPHHECKGDGPEAVTVWEPNGCHAQ
jgi:hypothetical protein